MQMLLLPQQLRALAVCALAASTMACGNPLTATAWLNLEPGSKIQSSGFESPTEGGVFVKIDVDLSNLLVPTGTIEVEQVRIAGQGFPFGDLCIRKDEANAVVGGFTMIPHDFEVTGTRQMVVPAGARYLFLSPFDVAFSDNISSSLRVGVSVE